MARKSGIATWPDRREPGETDTDAGKSGQRGTTGKEEWEGVLRRELVLQAGAQADK